MDFGIISLVAGAVMRYWRDEYLQIWAEGGDGLWYIGREGWDWEIAVSEETCERGQ